METDASIPYIDDLKNSNNVISYSKIRNELLNQIKPIDLVNEAVRLGQKNLNDKLYLVLVVDHILELAKKNKWVMYKKYGIIYLHNGTHWVEIAFDEFRDFLGTAAEKMGIPKLTAEYYRFRNQLFKQFLFVARLPSLETSKKKRR